MLTREDQEALNWANEYVPFDEREGLLKDLRIGDLPNDETIKPKFLAAGRSELQKLIDSRRQALGKIGTESIPFKPYQPSVTEEVLKPAARAAGQTALDVTRPVAEMAAPFIPKKPAVIPPPAPELGPPAPIGKTDEGRTLYKPPGEAPPFSEVSITVTHPEINGGQPTNIPSVYGGQVLSEPDAIKRVIAAGGKDPETGRSLPAFASIDQAVQAAKARSASLGKNIPPPDLVPPMRATGPRPMVPRGTVLPMDQSGLSPVPMPPPAPAPSFGDSFMKGVKGGALQLGASAAGTVERLQEPDTTLKMFSSQVGDALSKEAEQYAAAPGAKDRTFFQKVGDILTDPDRLANLMGNVMVQTAPSLAAFMAGAMTPIPGAGPAAMVGTIYFQQAGDSYREAYATYKQQGLSDAEAHRQAYTASGLAGLVSSAVNVLSVPASQMAPFKQKLTNLVLQYALNVGVDTADQLTQNLVAKGTFDPNREITEGVPEAMVGSMAMSAPETMAAVKSVATGLGIVRTGKKPPQEMAPVPGIEAPPVAEAPPAALPAEGAPPRRLKQEVAGIAAQIPAELPVKPAGGPFLRKKPPTVDEIHALADAKGIPWDNDPAFQALTKDVTGKEHLDDLSARELLAMRQAIQQMPAQTPTVNAPVAAPPPAPSAAPAEPVASVGAPVIMQAGHVGLPETTHPATSDQAAKLERQIKELDRLLAKTPDMSGLKPGSAARKRVEAQLDRHLQDYHALTGKTVVQGFQGPLNIHAPVGTPSPTAPIAPTTSKEAGPTGQPTVAGPVPSSVPEPTAPQDTRAAQVAYTLGQQNDWINQHGSAAMDPMRRKVISGILEGLPEVLPRATPKERAQIEQHAKRLGEVLSGHAEVEPGGVTIRKARIIPTRAGVQAVPQTVTSPPGVEAPAPELVAQPLTGGPAETLSHTPTPKGRFAGWSDGQIKTQIQRLKERLNRPPHRRLGITAQERAETEKELQTYTEELARREQPRVAAPDELNQSRGLTPTQPAGPYEAVVQEMLARPAIQAAVAANEGKRSTADEFKRPDGTYDPARVHDVHEPAIVKRLKPATGQQPIIRFIIGLPGSGKTKNAKARMTDLENFTQVDVDDIRKDLPEYDRVTTTLTHEEGGHIAGQLVDRAKAQNGNIVWDGVGRKTDKLLQQAKDFQRSGYRVEVVFVDLATDEAIRRAVKRFEDGKERFVPPRWIAEVDKKPTQTYDAIKEIADEWTRLDNNVPLGEPARVIESGTRGGRTEPAHERGRGRLDRERIPGPEAPAQPHPAGVTAPAVPEPAPTAVPAATTAAATTDQRIVDGSTKLAHDISQLLTKGQTVTTEILRRWAQAYFGGTEAEGTFTPKDMFDALELGVNQYILTQKVLAPTVAPTAAKAREQMELIRSAIMDKIPSQGTRRTAEQQEFQQFSTPPDLAYLMNWAAKVGSKDVMLEPSAGLGGIAVFAENAGASVEVNELSGRRADLVKTILPTVFRENAEQIANILPGKAGFKIPTVVVMNPPFSSTAGRIEGQRKSVNALKHIDQAMKLLAPNGRLVALIGEGFMGQSTSVARAIDELGKQYALRASVVVSGEGYKKYGTTFDNRILVFDKTAPAATDTTVKASVGSPMEAASVLEEVRNGRLPIQATQRVASPEQRPAQPGGEAVAEGGQRAARGGQPVPAPTDVVGPGTRESVEPQPRGRELPRATSGGLVPAGRPGTGAGVAAGKPRGVRGERPAGSERPAAQPHAKEGGPVPAATTGRTPAAAETSERGVPSSVPVESGVTVETASAPAPSEKPLTDAIFETYQPAKLKIKGAQAHPGRLVQSAAMADTLPPDPTYTPNLPKELIDSGGLSLAQLETPVYAGQAHAVILPDGSRKGFMNGDGTGVGKGRQIAAVILDNFRQGREKAVWISESARLIADAKRDWKDIGGDPAVVFELGKFKRTDAVDKPKGILFATYTTVASGLQTDKSGIISEKTDKKTQQKVRSRVNQMLDWLGKDFDGVLVFDESHNMQNSSQQKGPRGQQEAAVKALASIELEKALPKARVLYTSATGATKVESLSYLRRLGLWGEGTAFPSSTKFIESMSKGGLAAMEVVARDMKALGSYLSRSLDFSEVTYARLEHQLDEGQQATYNRLAEFWQIVLQDIDKALELTGVKEGNKTKNALAKSALLSAFWGSQQRFFNQILTSVQMPSVIADIRKNLADGKAIVIQLVNTNEAALTREAAKIQMEDGNLEDLDLTPRQQLGQFLTNSFPVEQYEEYMDDEGNVRSRPVKDASGHPVYNQEAVAKRDALLAELGNLKVPDGPLEYLLNTFGPDAVAEVTGRTKRAVRIVDNLGREKTVLQPRSPAISSHEAGEFLDDKRQILVFSDAGGTGRSFHSDKRFKNQRQRVHYLVQPGWRSDKAVQGFGRTHRTNEANTPHYVLVMTNLKGHKRFISTIARRLDQLGALTKGERKTGSSGIITSADNLENDYAKAALKNFYESVIRGQVPGITREDMLEGKMGLTNMVDERTGQVNQSKAVDVPQFLNRILALTIKDQNTVFAAFEERMNHAIEIAASTGTLDVGLETYKAKSVKVLQEIPVYQHPATGATTRMVEMDTQHAVNLVPPAEIEKNPKFVGYYQSNQTKKVYGAISTGTRTSDTGEVQHFFRLQSPVHEKYYYVSEHARDEHYAPVNNDTGRTLWEGVLAKHPGIRNEKVHLLAGTLLPIWDRLPDDHVRVMRVQTDDGKRYLGRIIRESDVQAVLRRLGATTELPKIAGAEAIKTIIQKRAKIALVNGWKLERRTVAGETRIELLGHSVKDSWTALRKAGVFQEVIDFKTRYFIPTGDAGASAFDSIVASHAVAEINYPETGKGELGQHMKAFGRTLTRDQFMDHISGLNLKDSFGELDVNDLKEISGAAPYWTLQTIHPKTLQPTKAPSVTKYPIIVANKEILDGRRRRQQAMQRGDKAIHAWVGTESPIASMMKVNTPEGKQRAAAGLTPDQLRQMGEGLYSEPPSKVIVKEMTQNAIDATRGLTNPAASQVRVDVFPEKHQIVVEDTGSGILPETAFKELVDFGGSKKAVDAAGLFGVAKVVIFSGAKDIKIVSRAYEEGRGIVETTLTGNGEDWLTQDKGLEVEIRTADPDAPTGTKMTMTYPDSMKFDMPKIRMWLENLIALHRMPGKIIAAIDGFELDPSKRLEGQQLSKMKTLDFSGGTIDFWVSDKKEEMTSGRIEILNQGIPQFTSSFSFGKDHKLELPKIVVANIRSRREAGQKNYPFTTNREKLRGDVKEIIRKYIMGDLVKDAVNEEREKYKQAMEEGPEIPGTEQQVIDTSGTQPKELVEALAARPYMKPFMEASNAAFKLIQKELMGKGTVYGEVVYQGIGLGKDYLGVNIGGGSVFAGDPNNYILLNPYLIYRQAAAFATSEGFSNEQMLEEVSSLTASTIIHELTHQGVRGHNEKFSSLLTDNHAATRKSLFAATEAMIDALKKGDIHEGKDIFAGIAADLAALEKNWSADQDDIFEQISAGHAGRGGHRERAGHPAAGAAVRAQAEGAVSRHAENAPEALAGRPSVSRGGAALLHSERGSIPTSLRPAPSRLLGTTSADGRFHSSHEEVEARVQQAKKGVQPTSWKDWAQEHLTTVWHMVSREFQHLPDTAEFSQLRNGLLSLQKQRGVQADRVERALASIVDPLNPAQYDLLEWKALLADLAREAGQGHRLPFGYTPDQVNHDLEGVDELLEQNPVVRKAWEKRQALWKSLKTEYQDAMDAIGFNVGRRLTKVDYFRHQVLDYAREQKLMGGTGKRLQTPTGRGFLKARAGSTMDINANYIQAEFEVMAQMAYDTQLAKVIRTVDRVHNIYPSLQAEAKAKNQAALDRMIQAEKAAPGGLSIIEQELKTFRQKLGMNHHLLRRALELDESAPLTMDQIQQIASDPNSPGQPAALGIFKAISQRRAYVRNLLGKNFVTWDTLVPEGYALWQPRQGNIFYMADSIPAQLAKALHENALEQVGLHKEDLRTMLAMGGPREQYVVKQEVSDTLGEMERPAPNWFVDANRAALSHWKQLVLVAPRRVIRYNLRNLTGDADATFVGNPKAFKRMRQAMVEMWPVLFENKPLEGEAKQWVERGGYGSTLQVQEMGDLNDLKAFRAMIEKESKGDWAKAPMAVWNRYWKTARLATDYRETWLRYANYLEYLSQMQAGNGKPENFGASRKLTVMALPDVRDRAFKLANELTGAYDRISVAGQTLRRFWYPFWSWQEVNTTRYAALIRNALSEQDAEQTLRATAAIGKRAAVGGGAFLLKASALWVLLQVWNNFLFDDEERELRETDPSVANRPHIILGSKNEEGKIPFFAGLGALGDALSWLGLDTAPSLVSDYLHGRMTLGEVWQNTWHAPVNKVWQGLTPLVKGTVELIGRIQTYPDVFRPRPLQDRGEYLAGQLTLAPEYRKAMGKPGKPYLGGEDLAGLVVQSVKPEQAAYYTWQEIERKYLDRMGKESGGLYWRSPMGEAVANIALAKRFGDPAEEQHYRNEYAQMLREKHGKAFYPGLVNRELSHNLYTKAPLAGVSVKERQQIVAQMDPQERRVLQKAEKYYEETMLAILPEGERRSLIGRLRSRGWLTRPNSVLAPAPAPSLVPESGVVE